MSSSFPNPIVLDNPSPPSNLQDTHALSTQKSLLRVLMISFSQSLETSLFRYFSSLLIGKNFSWLGRHCPWRTYFQSSSRSLVARACHLMSLSLDSTQTLFKVPRTASKSIRSSFLFRRYVKLATSFSAFLNADLSLRVNSDPVSLLPTFGTFSKQFLGKCNDGAASCILFMRGQVRELTN